VVQLRTRRFKSGSSVFQTQLDPNHDLFVGHFYPVAWPEQRSYRKPVWSLGCIVTSPAESGSGGLDLRRVSVTSAIEMAPTYASDILQACTELVQLATRQSETARRGWASTALYRQLITAFQEEIWVAQRSVSVPQVLE
jgi:hypothetical protein